MDDDFTVKKEALHREIDKFMKVLEERSNRHRHTNTFINIARVAITIAITVLGFGIQSYPIAFLGAVLTGITIIQEMYPLAEMAFFYRAALGDLDALRDQLMFVVDDDQEQLDQVVTRFSEIKRYVARDVPRGSQVRNIETFD